MLISADHGKYKLHKAVNTEQNSERNKKLEVQLKLNPLIYYSIFCRSLIGRYFER